MLDSDDDATLDNEWDRFKGDNVGILCFCCRLPVILIPLYSKRQMSEWGLYLWRIWRDLSCACLVESELSFIITESLLKIILQVQHWTVLLLFFIKLDPVALSRRSSAWSWRSWVVLASYYDFCFENLSDITITLPFIRSLNAGSVPPVGYEQSLTPGGLSGDNSRKFTITCGFRIASQLVVVTQTIDMQAPLRLKSSKSYSIRRLCNHTDCVIGNKALVSNLLSVHLVRNVAGNTLVSFHANTGLTTTQASYLHERVRFAGT